MAKGHRGRQQTTQANGPSGKSNKSAAVDKENANDTHNNLQSGKGRNRNREKPKIINDDHKPESVEDTLNHVSEKKEPVVHTVHSKVQPTTEQLMIAKIIDHSDDPHQKRKIKQVMDFTDKPEDEVATALFDAAWDENRAIELLLENGDHLSAWEETGKKKKAKKAANEEKEDWDNDHDNGGGFQDPREKSRQRGPPRMRRGGSNTKGGRNDFNENGEQVVSSGGRGGRRGGGGGDRGDRGDRGDQPPRRRNGDRGDRGERGGGGRTFVNNRQQSSGGDRDRTGNDRGYENHHRGERGGPTSNPVGFQGSIDTWNNPNDQNSSDHRGDRSGDPSAVGGGGGGGGPGESRPSRGGRGGRGGGRSSKDAFENAGNWGDDFPQADDWDNEEYTGSLADTKVFTASGGGGPMGGKQRTPPGAAQAPGGQPGQPQQQAMPPNQPNNQAQQPQPVGANSQRGFATGLTNGPPPTVGGTNSYSQSIDLSTLLQKPTTQSSVSGSSAAPGSQFNQQASETLKAVVGIPSSNTSQQQPAKDSVAPNSSLYSYAAQASAFTSINKSTNQPPAGAGVPIRQQPQQNQSSAKGGPASQAVGGRTSGGRLPTASSKAPAVEMPGDSLGRLDVQFGGLDLQFGGGAGSASSEAMTSGFEFGSTSGGGDDKTPSGNANPAPSNKSEVSSFAPSAKEVNKSLSNALGTGSKLNPGAGPVSAGVSGSGAPNSQHQDSFSKSSSVSSSTVTPSLNPAGVAPPSTGSSNSGGYNKPATGSADLGSYSGYNNYNKSYNSYQYQQQYSNNYSSQQQQQQHQQGSSGGSTNSSGYKGAQFDKYDPQMNNPAAAVLGLANTNTTNALSGKVSASTASKVNMPNLPPGVASMLHPQYVAAAGLAPAAFYGLQQPMYGAYGNTGLEDLAAIQRASASAAGLHTLPTTGYYDPNNQFAATSLGAAVANRDGNTNLANLNSLAGIVSTTSSNSGSSGSTIGSSSGFGGSTTSTMASGSNVDSTSSPGPNAASGIHSSVGGVGSGSSSGVGGSTGNSSAAGNSGSSGQHHVQQQQAQQSQQQTAFNLAAASNAFAAQQMPPGYAYYFGNVGNMGNMGLQPYGQAQPGHVYQPTAMTVPGAGATATSQFQKSYGTSYGSGYDTLGQQGNKDFSSNYSSNGQSKSTGGSAAAAGSGKGAHQYWGNTLTTGQLW